MGRYRCTFWGLFACFFHLNLFGVRLFPLSLALAVFTYGLYGIYGQTGNRHILLAAKLSLANTLIRLSSYSTLLFINSIYQYTPSYFQYILFALLDLFLMLTIWNLLAGMREIFEPLREHSKISGWIAACSRGMIVIPILFTLAVLLYGILMNVMFTGSGDAERSEIAVVCCNILPIIYALFLITRYKHYLNLSDHMEPFDGGSGEANQQTTAV